MGVNQPALILQQTAAFLSQTLSTIKPDDHQGFCAFFDAIDAKIDDLCKIVASGLSNEEVAALSARPFPPALTLLKHRLFDPLPENIQALKAWAVAAFEKGPSDPDFPRALLLARMILRPYEVKQPESYAGLPPVLLQRLVEFQLEPPQFVRMGDGALYAAHVEQTLERILAFLSGNAVPKPEHIIVITQFNEFYGRNLLHITDASLRNIMDLRNRIMRYISMALIKVPLRFAQQPFEATRKIRIGIIMKTMMAGGETWAALANISGLDRDRYDITVFCFDYNAGYTHDIAFYRELVTKVDRIVSLPVHDIAESVLCIRKFDLDLLWHQSHLGLSETGQAGYIFTHQLARVQFADYGMHAQTTGNPFFQYYIGIDPFEEPKPTESEFTETELITKGMHIYIPDAWSDAPNKEITKDSLGIPQDALVYFGGAAAAKYSAELLSAWMKILQRVPGSYLVLYPFNPSWDPKPDMIFAFHCRLRRQLDLMGIEKSRVKVLPHVNGQAIAKFHAWGHVYLSTFPHVGVTSLSDALRGGLCPAVVMASYARGRGDANILEGYGLRDLTNRTVESYIDFAVKCGLDESYRNEIQQRVRHAWARQRLDFRSYLARERASLIDHICDLSFEEEKPGDDQAASSVA